MPDFNPYTLRSLDITDRNHYFGRESQFNNLYGSIRNGENIVIMGPQGVGKTQFLNCAFNEETRKELAEERIFVSKLYNGITGDADAFFRAVASSLIDDADILLELDDDTAHNTYTALLKKAKSQQEAGANGQGYLESLCKFFMRKGYTVYVVIDCFEQFVNSRHITKEHHDVLRSFLANTTLRLVVATDFDFNKSTLPREAAGSLLLQLFSGNEITLPGLSLSECNAFLCSLGGSCDFGSEEVNLLYRFSGGIPYLLCKCAYYAYLQKKDSSSINNEGWKHITRQLLESEHGLFENWTRHLDEKEIVLLKDRAKGGELSAINKDGWDGAVDQLVKRGLLLDLSESDAIERRHMYPISSLLFMLYCGDPGTKLEAYCEESPHAPVIQEIHNHFEAGSNAKLYGSGATDNSQTLNADNVLISNGISFQELIHWIANPDQDNLATADFQQFLGNTLSDRFRRFLADSAPPERGSESDDEYELICDQHFSSIGSKMLPDIQVNEDNEAIIEVDAEELVTVDQRFDAVRHRRPALTDEVLMSQSERCQLYLKLSVIVEDALAVVGMFMEDYSPQLVLYGKALEQSLRDNLYVFFSTDSTISVWDTFKQREDPDSSNVFKNLIRDMSFIGSYVFVLKNQREYISHRCVDNGIRINGKTQGFYEWKYWWKDLTGSIANAKKIRDKTDHASQTAPVKADLDAMCNRLFGDANNPGVLTRLTIGLDLALLLMEEENLESIHSLENTEREAVISKIKPGNALDCTILDGNYVAKISKSAVNKFLSTHDNIELCEGMHICAMLGLYELQDGNEFFHATLVSIL